MSGLEVVGVLLGAIPLVVSALKNYKETKQRFIWFASKEVYVNRLIQALNEQIFFIRADVSLALRTADLEQERITAFLDDPNLNPLGDSDITDALQDYLGDGFHVYKNCLTGCQAIVSDIVKNLSGLISDSKVENGDLAAIIKAHPKKDGRFEFTKKIKFSLQKDDLDNQIRELNRATKILSRINGESTRRELVTVQSTSRTISKFTYALASIRESAHRLYSAISLGYEDNCHEEHEAKLFLQTRSAIMQSSKPKNLRKLPVAFDVAFSPVAALDKGGWSYKTEVKIIEVEDGLGDFAVKLDDSGIKNQAVVAFNLPDTPSAASPPLDKVENICILIHTAHKSGKYSEFYLSGAGDLCSAHCPPITPSPIKQDAGFITLKDIFAGASSGLPKLPLNQRIALSFNIASSVMQLHSTPWLAFPLTSSSICFTQGASINTRQPFIRAIFANCRKGCPRCYDKTRDAMLELGILLLELWHARLIETFALENGFTLNKSFGSRYEAAQDWILQSEGDMMPFYLDAATRCIECTFTTSSSRPDWKDPTFQKSVCHHAVPENTFLHWLLYSSWHYVLFWIYVLWFKEAFSPPAPNAAHCDHAPATLWLERKGIFRFYQSQISAHHLHRPSSPRTNRGLLDPVELVSSAPAYLFNDDYGSLHVV